MSVRRSVKPATPPPSHGKDAPVDESVGAVLGRLRASGGRATSARRILLRSLFSNPRHRTAEQLAVEVQAEAPDVHLSTVYRYLDELERIGVVSHVHLGHGPASYHVAPATHGHLVCEECGAVIEVDDAEFGSLSRQLLDVHDFAVDPHHFAMLGRCANCRAGTRSS